MTTTDREDLYETATEAYNAAAEAQAARAPLGSRDTAPWRDGIRAVVDLVLDARPEHQPWDCIRETDLLIRGHWNFDGIDSTRLLALAKDLEAEHQAERKKAAAEAEREKLIEQAAQVLFQRRHGDVSLDRATDQIQAEYHAEARALADAGLLSAPTTDGGAK